MKIGVIGTGYVGLVTGTCFAESGNTVICIDIDKEKVKKMKEGHIPIYEPGLEDMFKRNIQEGRLSFSTKLDDAMGSKVIFLCLPTPSEEDGSADLSHILNVAGKIGPMIKNKDYVVIVDKSTVPVGTARKVRKALKEGGATDFDVVSNPEFLREGQAVNDFMRPERIVIGSSSARAEKIMKQLYRPFVLRRPQEAIIVTDVPSAELIKYAANAFLATKISFINQLSGLCSIVGADIGMVRRGIGSDSRIGDQFLYPGPGYGGSCLPKDVKAIIKTADEHGYCLDVIEAVNEANERQKLVIPQKVKGYYGDDLSNRTFALWGLAFKDNTDDIRESPALTIVGSLLAAGANLNLFDPEAMTRFKELYPASKKVRYAKHQYDTLIGADALIIATNWREFSTPDFDLIKQKLSSPVIFDGRNMYDIETMTDLGFYYASMGRKVVGDKVK